MAVVFPDYTQVLCSVGYLFERSEQLDADKPEFVASDMFEQEGVVLQVFIGQVVLDLSDQLLDELWIWGLPALLLQLPSTGPGTAVCGENNMHHGQRRLFSSASLKQQSVSYPKLQKRQLLHISLSLIQKASVLQVVGNFPPAVLLTAFDKLRLQP